MDYEKITREQFSTFLNTTPKEETEKWGLLGVGITSYGIEFNPNITTEKWIINKNSTSTLENNQKQGDVSQAIHKGDPCFEYVYSLMDKIGADVETEVLDVDMWNFTESEEIKSYKAKKSQCMIAVTSYGGENATIGYTLHYNGDPIEGSVTIIDGSPTFTPNN